MTTGPRLPGTSSMSPLHRAPMANSVFAEPWESRLRAWRWRWTTPVPSTWATSATPLAARISALQASRRKVSATRTTGAGKAPSRTSSSPAACSVRQQRRGPRPRPAARPAGYDHGHDHGDDGHGHDHGDHHHEQPLSRRKCSQMRGVSCCHRRLAQMVFSHQECLAYLARRSLKTIPLEARTSRRTARGGVGRCRTRSTSPRPVGRRLRAVHSDRGIDPSRRAPAHRQAPGDPQRQASGQDTPSTRYSWKTRKVGGDGGAIALASASSTASPQPSFVEGKARPSVAWYQPTNSSSGTVPRMITSLPSARPKASILV